MSERSTVAGDLQVGDYLMVEGIAGVEPLGTVVLVDLHPGGAVAVLAGGCVHAFMATDDVRIRRN